MKTRSDFQLLWETNVGASVRKSETIVGNDNNLIIDSLGQNVIAVYQSSSGGLYPTAGKSLANKALSINPILDAIQESKKILKLEDDWDDDGSPAYKERTWKMATDFLINNTLQLLKKLNINTQAPKILPGPNGSIDIYWKTTQQQLLINIPEEPGEPATYYGNNGQVINGTLDIFGDNQWLLLWLVG